MKRLSAVVSLFLAVAMVAVSIPPHQVRPGARVAHAQAASLVLNPSSGHSPAVTGTLSGSGWCNGANVTVSSVPAGNASGSGSTVGGNLIGTFTATGTPGQLVAIKVDASCRVGSSTARANFRFDDATAVPSPSPTSTPTKTLVPTPTSTSTPTPSPSATASPVPGNTPTPTATPAPGTTPTATSTRPNSTPTSTATSSGSVPTPRPTPNPGTGIVRVLGCTPAASSVSVQMTFVGGLPPPPALLDVSLPAIQGPSPQLFAFALPATAPHGSLFELTPKVSDPDCPPSDPTPISWDPGASESISIILPAGKSELLESSHGIAAPGGEIIQWVTFRQFSGDAFSGAQLFRLESTANFDGILWQVSLQPFSGAFDPLDPDPAGMLASGNVTCSSTPFCHFIVNFSDFMPPPNEQTPPASWTGEAMTSVFDLLPLFPVAQGVASKETVAVAPTGSSPKSKLDFGGTAPSIPLTAGLYTPPRDFYFRAIPTKGTALLGPNSNSVIVRWSGYDSVDTSTVQYVDCFTHPDDDVCKAPPGPPRYKIQIESYHGWISPKAGHAGCYLVTKTTTTMVTPVGPTATYPEGQLLCPPKPKDPGLLEAIVSFVVDAVNWVSNTYAKLKEAVIDFVSMFVPEAICPKSCIGILLDIALTALGIPPSIPNFDQLMDQGLDYLAAEVVEGVGVPKEIQDLAIGPAKDIAIEEFKKAAEEEVKKGIKAGIEDMQNSLASEVSFIPDGVPIKPDPDGAYQPPAITFRVTRPAGAAICTSNLVVNGSVSSATSPGLNLDGKSWAWLYSQRLVTLPALDEGESVEIPLILKPRLDWGFSGAKYGSYNEAAIAWSNLYNQAVAEMAVLGNSCAGSDFLTAPATSSVVGATASP